jgi:hypothetical protein
MFWNPAKPKNDVSISFLWNCHHVCFTIAPNVWKRDTVWHARAVAKAGDTDLRLFIKQLSQQSYETVKVLFERKQPIENIPPILHLGLAEGVGHFYVTTFLPGRTLAEIDERFLRTIVDRDQVAALWGGVAASLLHVIQALSANELFYPDLSPKNIMVTGSPPKAWVIDVDSCIPLKCPLEGQKFENRFTLSGANKVLGIIEKQSVFSKIFRQRRTIDNAQRAQAALIAFVQFLLRVVDAHRNEEFDVVLEALKGPRSPELDKDSPCERTRLLLEAMVERWKAKLGGIGSGDWTGCSEIVSKFVARIAEKPPSPEIEIRIKEWLRIANCIAERYTIAERLARWPPELDRLPPEVMSDDLADAIGERRRLSGLLKAKDLITEKIRQWKGSDCWHLREGIARSALEVDITNCMSDLKRAMEPLETLDADYDLLQLWSQGLNKLAEHLRDVVGRLRSNDQITAGKIVDEIASSRYCDHPVIADLAASRTWTATPWLRGSFLADILEAQQQGQFMTLRELQSLLPASVRASAILTQYRFVQSSVSDLLSAVENKLRDNRLDDASDDLGKVAVLAPDSPELRVLRARCKVARLTWMANSERS